jgi:hypothetical protein
VGEALPMHTSQNAVNGIAVRRFYRRSRLFTTRSEKNLTTVAKFSQPIIGPPFYPSTRSRVLNYAGKAIFIITLLVVKLLLHLVHVVDSHFAQWYWDAVEGITAHPSLIDFPARTELHHLR